MRRRAGALSSWPTASAATPRARSPARNRSSRSAASCARGAPLIADFLKEPGRDDRREPVRRLLESAVQSACYMVFGMAELDPSQKGMSTTISALLIAGGYGVLAQVGDSRIYRVRGGVGQQLTEDHTLRQLQAQAGPHQRGRRAHHEGQERDHARRRAQGLRRGRHARDRRAGRAIAICSAPTGCTATCKRASSRACCRARRQSRRRNASSSWPTNAAGATTSPSCSSSSTDWSNPRSGPSSLRRRSLAARASPPDSRVARWFRRRRAAAVGARRERQLIGARSTTAAAGWCRRGAGASADRRALDGRCRCRVAVGAGVSRSARARRR